MTNEVSYFLRKLVRNSSVANMEELGAFVEYHRLDDDAFRKELLLKLTEEVEEVQAAENDTELTEELADVAEIIDALLKLKGLTWADLEALRAKKNAKRGDFSERLYVDYINCPKGSYWDQYAAKSPEKYPVRETE